MKHIQQLAFAILLGVSVNAHASSLDETTVQLPQSKIELLKKPLVYLPQKGEGFDPFGNFEEGLDPKNENALSISNESGNLDVSLAGSNWVNGEKDQSTESMIDALEFSSDWQRYLVTIKNQGKISYQIIINVDRNNKLARVHMREDQDGRLSAWASVVDYGQ